MAFATAADISARLGRALTATEEGQVAAFIADATSHLQSIIGQRVESATTTIRQKTLWRDMTVRLVQFPVRSVDTVKVNGTTLIPITDWYWRGDDTVYIVGGYTTTTLKYAVVDVTYTHGLTAVPADLKQLTCALVMQALAQIQRTGTMDPGPVQSERIDDYSITYQAGGSALGMTVPKAVADRLRAQYGQGAYVTEES